VSALNQTPAVDSAALVIAGENDDLTTEQPAAANADMHLPLAPADGTLAVYDRGCDLAVCPEPPVNAVSRLLFTIPPADTAAIKECLADKERAEEEHKKYWVAAPELVRSACDSKALLTDIQANGRLEEIAASMAGHAFGTDARILFRKLVHKSGVLDGLLDAERVIFQIWEEACEAPGDWRWLVRHVRELDGGEPPKPGASLPVGTVPETSHLTTDQKNAARLAAHFGGKELIASARSFFVWQGTHWERDPSEATRYGAQLSGIVREEAKGWRATFESMAAADPRGKKLEATVWRDMSQLEDNLRATSDGLAMVNALYKAEALEKWQKSCEMRTNITNALGLLRDLLTVDPESFDRNPVLLNC
jgi:hypothetical protein